MSRSVEPQETRGSGLPRQHNIFLCKIARNPRQRFDIRIGIKYGNRPVHETIQPQIRLFITPKMLCKRPGTVSTALNIDVLEVGTSTVREVPDNSNLTLQSNSLTTASTIRTVGSEKSE